MKRGLLAITLTSLLTLAACGPSAEGLINDGNEAYDSQNYEAALAAYQQAQSESPELAEPHYNAANVHYRTQNFGQARQEIEQTLITDEGDLTQSSYYNLGNTFFQNQEFDQAIEAYKEALRLNPDDFEAKHNLELALQQQQEQQKQQEQQDQPPQDGQQGDQQQDQPPQDGQQGDQQQDQPPQDGQQGDQQQSGQVGNEQTEGQAGGNAEIVNGLTEERARQLFEAASQGTKSLEEYLQQILVAPGGPSAQDW